MGYDLHITRAKSWADSANHQISSDEWLAYIERDPELMLSPDDGPYFARWNGKSKYPDPWLDWSDGNIYAKSPDEPLIDKMVAIAWELHAQVQGDDGEIYHSGQELPVYPATSFCDRLRNWLQRLRPAPHIKEITPVFKVGDRVLDAFRRETTVIEINPKANHELGRIKLRYDDGRETSSPIVGCGLTPVGIDPIGEEPQS